MTPLATLADRVEGAHAVETSALLQEAFDALMPRQLPSRPGTVTWNRAYLHFKVLLGAEAFLDAAMGLMPEGPEGLRMSFKVEHFYLGNGICQARASVWDGLGGVSSLDTASRAATPALALVAACLRARASVAS